MRLRTTTPSNYPFLILDSGLNPHIAGALSELGFSIKSVQSIFGVGPSDRVEDEEIIERIASEFGFRGVWVTKDNSSKRVHMELIQARSISVIWIRQQELSTQQQTRIVIYCYPRVHQDLLESTRPIHYEVSFQGQPNRERITLVNQRTAIRRRQRRR